MKKDKTMILDDLSKSELRQHCKRMRRAAAQMVGNNGAEQAARHALSLIGKDAGNIIVALYWPIEDELDTRPLATDLVKRGFSLALPAIDQKEAPLIFRQWEPGDPISKGRFAAHEPEPEAPKVDPDILIVPLLAFDAGCNRVGYGGGYYDRTLAARPRVKAFGFAYAAQLVDDIPVEDYDIPLQAVITEEGVVLPGRRK